jgi:hypothetical protein
MLRCKRCTKFISFPEHHTSTKEKCDLDIGSIVTFTKKSEAQKYIEEKKLDAKIENTLF